MNSLTTFDITTLSVTENIQFLCAEHPMFDCYADCHYAEWHYAICHFTVALTFPTILCNTENIIGAVPKW